jgi:hypothetical protein
MRNPASRAKAFRKYLDPLIGVQGPHRVGPALRDQAAIGLADLRPEKASSTQRSGA